jgi:glycosyltransferase involved in cell wall biosynthesis
VVRNVPERTEGAPIPTSLLRERLGIPESEFVLLYQGVLAPGRGIELLINAFENVPADRHLVFLGFGPLEERIRQLAAVRGNVHFHPAVSPAELRQFTASADVGLVQTEDSCLSYHLSLPNKLFEYLEAGIPVLSSDLPCPRAVVERFQCGWVANGSDAIRDWASWLDRSSLAAMRRGALEARAHFDWRDEAKTMFTMYDHLLS